MTILVCWRANPAGRSKKMKMKRERKWLFLTALIALILPFFLLPGYAGAQQIYHGDGARNNGSGGWTIGAAPSNGCVLCHSIHGAIASKPCLSCHRGVASHIGVASDMTSYLMTGHKNVLRKVTPGMPWANADGSPLRTSDTHAAGSLYNSGSTFDWTNGLITVGAGPTLPFPPNPLAGATQDLFYIFGGWLDPSRLDTIWGGGFTGEQFASGTYECARCHTTGYRFDNSGPEPTTYNGIPITDAEFSRIPTDFTTGTSSWSLDGIQCERCHNADNGVNNHTASGVIAGGIPTKPLNEIGTATCLQCHREELVDNVARTINPVNTPTVSDGGYCADLTSPDYNTCTANGKTWVYAPFFDHGSGPTFLNSPHARFTGSVNQNAQNSPDLTVSLVGSYSSKFSPDPTNPARNNGCMGCHDPHQSVTQSTATPFKKNCNDCHALAQNLLQSSHHPQGPGTPFPTRTSADIPGSCQVCHMSQSYHLFRISTDPNYSTFPTPALLYAGTQTTGNTAPDGAYTNAVWSDLDLACGQCHVGSGSLFTTPTPGTRVFSKSRLAALAKNIHGKDTYTITASVSGSGSITPSGDVAVTSGGSQSFSIAPAPGYVIVKVVVDGATVGAVGSYTFNNVTANHTISVTFAQPLTITASSGPNGTLTPSGNVSLLSGANQTFTFTPAAGYRVLDVVVDGVSYGPRNSWYFGNITTNHTIAVSFTPDVYTITASVTNSGSITPAGVTTVNKGANQTYTITPGPGYKILYVRVDGMNIGSPSSYTFTNVTMNHTIKAYFVTQ